MRKIKRMNGKAATMRGGVFLWLLCVMMTCALMCWAGFAFAAGLEVSVTGEDWDIATDEGIIGPGEQVTSTADRWTVTGSYDGTENIDIKVEDAANPDVWTASTDGNNGVDIFVLRENDAEGKIIHGTDENLVTGLGQQPATSSFGLYFQAPAIDSEGGAHTLTVILTAKNWAATPCAGFDSLGDCWYLGAVGESCDTVCATHGGCRLTEWNDSDWDVCQDWFPNPDATTNNSLSWAPGHYTSDVGDSICIRRTSPATRNCSAVRTEIAYFISPQRLCACNQ